MSVAANADLYAAPRQNIFFPGVTAGLEGQCVSLVKFFLQDMTSVSNPQAARGDARYVGKTLVAQGFADEVPYDQRRRGDVVCMEYGLYGHIYIQLSGGRVFEENVNWPGVSSKIVDGARVYASRIGSDSEAWRHDMHIYRIKSYNDGGNNMDYEDAKYLRYSALHRLPSDAEVKADVGAKTSTKAQSLMQSTEWLTQNDVLLRAYPQALETIKKLQAGESVTQAEIDELAKKADDLEQAIKNVNK